jgi:hypothetical protein
MAAMMCFKGASYGKGGAEAPPPRVPQRYAVTEAAVQAGVVHEHFRELREEAPQS